MPYNSSLPYSVYARGTDITPSGGGGGENLDETLQIDNTAGVNSIKMDGLNVNDVNVLATKRIITQNVNVGAVGTPTIILHGVTGDIECGDVLTGDISSVNIESTGTINYNLLDPPLPPFQPSMFVLTGSYETPTLTLFNSGTTYKMVGLSVNPTTLEYIEEYPPLPLPQGNLSVLNGWWANGLAGWYRVGYKHNPSSQPVPTGFADVFVTFITNILVYNNSGALGTPITTISLPYNNNSSAITLNCNGTRDIYLPLGYSIEISWLATTANGNQYQFDSVLQFSAYLISDGTP